MISMQQLEELESRVIKALHLIGDLRTENSKLENDNESLKGEVEEVKLTLEEKEQEIEKIKRELDATALELKELNEKEEILEKKIIGLLGKLDIIQGGVSIQPSSDYSAKEVRERPSKPAPSPKKDDKDLFIESDDDMIVIEDKIETREIDEELRVENVDSSDSSVFDQDDDIIIIDDEDDIQEKKQSKGKSPVSDDEDDIILLDDEDEIIIEDVDSNDIIIDDDEVRKPAKKASYDDDDDIIIIEDDEK